MQFFNLVLIGKIRFQTSVVEKNVFDEEKYIGTLCIQLNFVQFRKSNNETNGDVKKKKKLKR